MAFGAYIRKKREEKEIQLNDFAKMLDISPAYWSRIERELEKPPKDDLIRKAAEHLGLDVDDAFAAMGSVLSASPRLGSAVLQELLLCALWPVDPKPSPDVRYTGSVPILVVGSTGDAATPMEGTRRMYETLGNARLVVVDSFDHTSYGSNDCATRAVDDYLTELVIPDGEIDCP